MENGKEKKIIEIPVQTEGTATETSDSIRVKDERESKEKGLQEQLLRLQADFLNYKKRVDREKDEFKRSANGDLLLNMLPVLDDIERMIRHHEAEEFCPVEGVRLIQQKLLSTFIKVGLEPIPAVGNKFSPDLHEAVEVIETESEKDGMVVQEWERGYRLGDRLLRPSRVTVGKVVEKAGD